MLGNCGPELLPEGGSLCGTGGLGISGGFTISKPCCVWLRRGAVRRGSVCGLYQVLVSWLWKGVQQGKVPEVIRGWYLHIIIYYHVLSYIIIYYHVLSHIVMYSLQRGRCCLRGWVCSHELWCVQAARAASSLVFLYGSLLSGANAVCPAGPAAHRLLERPD